MNLVGRALGQSAPSMGAIVKAKVAAAKIFRIIDHKPSIDRNNESGMELESITGMVELKNVDFSYPSRPEVRILNNFSLNVPAGKTIALVGSSGSGKSTVVSLIERFYDPTSGKSFSNFMLNHLTELKALENLCVHKSVCVHLFLDENYVL